MCGVLHRTRVEPVRIRLHETELGVDVSRVVGYRLVCRCGWRAPRRKTVRQARADRAEHVAHG
jgi:hypothetical protein